MKDKAFYKANPWYRNDDISFLKICDAGSGDITTAGEFNCLIEAPNWSKDGKSLYFNSEGHIVRYDIGSGDQRVIETGYADNCNNDHVLSADGKMIAVSHGTREDGKSRIYTLPLEGGVPRLITPLGPSYLHGWSPDGKTLAYCAERNGEFDIYTVPAE